MSQIRKFAVVSDIHGNLPALNAVLDDARSRGISEFVFAGDYCLSGPFPDECIPIQDDPTLAGQIDTMIKHIAE